MPLLFIPMATKKKSAWGGLGLHLTEKSRHRMGDDKMWSPTPWSTLWSTQNGVPLKIMY